MTFPSVNSCWWPQTNQYLSRCFWSLNEGGRQREERALFENQESLQGRPAGGSCLFWEKVVLRHFLVALVSFFDICHCPPPNPPALLSCDWQKQDDFFSRCTMWWFNMHCEMIITIKFISTSITSHSSLSGVCVMRTLGIYCLSKFQVYSTVLLLLIITLYIQSPEFIHLATLLWSTFMRLPLLGKKKKKLHLCHISECTVSLQRCYRLMTTNLGSWLKPVTLQECERLYSSVNHLYMRDSSQGKRFPGGTMVKNSPANARSAREAGSIPGLGRSPGGGNGHPLQYSCLENPMDRGAWWASVHGVAQRQTRLSTHSTHC